MSEYWNITASLEKVANRQIIIYIMHELDLDKQVPPNLGDILGYCHEEVRLLVEDLKVGLKVGKANKEDLEYAENELGLLKEFEDKWRTEHKKWWKLDQEKEKI